MTDRHEGSRARARRWQAWLPWLGVVLFSLYAGSNFWTTRDAAFAGKLSSDNVVSMWFYDVASRSLAQGTWPEILSDFNHPRPWPRIKEFPALMDAVLAAPVGWLLDYPHQWNATLGLAVLVNGIGTALLARGAGARGVGLVVAGCLGALCRPVWKDFVMARMNAVWIGIPAASLGLALLALRMENPGLRGALRRLPLAIGAGLLGALAATVYPPYLLLFGPAAVLLGVAPLIQSRGWALLPLLGALGIGVAVAFPELSGILDSRQGELARQGCPDLYGALMADALWNTTPSTRQGLSLPGAAAYGWVLAPLVLLHRRRGAGLLLLAGTALWAILSLGPCAAARPGVPLHPQSWPLLGAMLPPMWKASAHLHDFGRFAAVAVLQAAVLGGLGLEALGGRHGWVRRIAALGIGAAVVGQVQYYVLSEGMDPTKWHAISEPVTTADLRAHGEDAFPAVELPFDRRMQFISSIYLPGPRLNPLRPGDHPPLRQPFIEWLMALGKGDTSQPTPTPGQALASGFRRVYLDPSRCNRGGVKRQACGADVRAALISVLGPPKTLDQGVMVWEIQR
ncbi:MAG: hypothetical protein VX265_12580 [Myxococcota bacterium]|nr:hypothetical protein [Myxococcota bacterium]